MAGVLHGVPIPESITLRLVLGLITKVREHTSERGWGVYLCIATEELDGEATRTDLKNFLITLGIRTSGAGFEHWDLPDWLKDLAIQAHIPTTKEDYNDNRRRLIFLEELRKAIQNA